MTLREENKIRLHISLRTRGARTDRWFVERMMPLEQGMGVEKSDEENDIY